MKKNNKGFTLIEVIIAITIFTTVIGLGYKVINSTNVVTKNQLKVFTEQQAANLVNKYITSDLEKVKEFENADTTSNPYKYIIKAKIDGNLEDIEYEVSTDIDKNTYTVTRKFKGSSIEIISNQPTNSELPFLIEPKEGFTNKYEVKLNGQNKAGDIKKYVFEVSSRIVGDIGSSNTGDSTSGGGSGNTGGTTDDSEIKEYTDGEIRIEITKNNNCLINLKLFEYSIAEDGTLECTEKTLGKATIGNQGGIIANMKEMNIVAKIPINDQDIIDLTVQIDNNKVHKEIYESSGLSNKLINDRIDIYCNDTSKVKKLLIDEITTNLVWNENIYSHVVDKSKDLIILNCTVEKGISQFSINFGKFNTNNTK